VGCIVLTGRPTTRRAIAMLLSYSHRFAFIHIPKTAGGSMSEAIGRHCEPVTGYWANRWLDRVGIHVNHYAPLRWKRFRTHTSAAIFQRHLPAAVFDELFKFSFVRNPWDLLVSYYHFVRKSPGHHRSGVANRLQSFEEYALYELRRNKISQTGMLTDRRGRLLVDFVGHTETIRWDFATICDRIGLEAELPHVNRSGHRDYRDYYTDRLIARVGAHFAEDIERFGYTFDGLAASPFRPAAEPAGVMLRAA
jgi:hypothetical protein